MRLRYLTYITSIQLLALAGTALAANPPAPGSPEAVRILGMVNAPEDFTEHPKVLNGFSEVFRVALGDAGLAARAAVGMPSLPNDIPVEVEAVFEIAPE